MMKTGIAVTGMGIVSSIGKNTWEFGNALRAGQCGIGRRENGPNPPIAGNIGAEIKDFSLESLVRQYENNGLPADFVKNLMICSYDAPPSVQVSVLCALEAWNQARVFKKPLDPHRLGIVAAGSNLSQNYHYGLLSKFQSTPQYLTPKYAIHYMDTDHVGTLSEIFKIQGEGFTLGGSSASGNAAIIKACQLIRLEILDACVVVGALAHLSPMELQGFYNVGALGGKRFCDQPQKACRPFDKDHEGFIYGQAGGCLVLESLNSAQKRGIPVLAEIPGGALVLDGNRLPNPNAEGEARAMQAALKQAGIEPGDIDYLNAHGTSSPLGDETEIKAIKQVFKENISQLWINSTKGLTGHCLTAAGVVEAVAAIIQMQERFIHPNLNLENPIDEECKFSRHQSIETPIHTTMNNSFGFGGINTSVIFKKPGYQCSIR
jgi:malonyl-ACP decarboxylase